MVVGAVVLTLVTVTWVYFLWSRRKFYMCALKMKGPWGYPFMGIAYKLRKMEELLYVMPTYAKEYQQKSIFTWIGPFPAVYTIDGRVADVVLQSPDCLNKGFLYKMVDEMGGNGILTSTLPKWSKHRKLMNPCFGYKVLLGLNSKFNSFARDFCEQLGHHVGCGEINVMELSVKLALRSSLALSMGIDVEKLENKGSRIFESFESLFEIVIYRTLRPWLISKVVYSWSSSYKCFLEGQQCIGDFVKDVMKNKFKTFENRDRGIDTDNDLKEESRASPIFIDQAVRSLQQNELTVEETGYELAVIIIAGYETTANTLYTMLLFLAMHPQLQERVFDEISTLYADKESDVTYEDFKNLVYLEMCINETLRLGPTVPLIGRKCGRDLHISKDITVPAGGDIYIDIFNMHRDEDTWGPTAQNFNPDRFLPGNLNNKQKSAFMPFSRGKRNCLGWQYAGIFLRIMLTQILRKYRFSTTFRYEDLKFKAFISLRYVTTPRLEVHRR